MLLLFENSSIFRKAYKMLKKLKRRVYEANMSLPRYGLVLFTWGNVSEVDAERRYMVIKPSGVRYEEMEWDQMCVIDMESGLTVDGDLRPSSDTPTHLELYRRFPDISGIAHTHSTYATAFAQAGLGIPCYGTTHADYFYGEIPCARPLKNNEIRDDYELNTGRVVADTFEIRAINPQAVPGALISGHGPFAWGESASDATVNAAFLEEIARLSYLTRRLAGSVPNNLTPVSQDLLDKHYYRKHGSNAYYGQK